MTLRQTNGKPRSKPSYMVKWFFTTEPRPFNGGKVSLSVLRKQCPHTNEVGPLPNTIQKLKWIKDLNGKI